MIKVTIESDGRIMAGETEVGLIPDFKYTDFSKNPNMAKHYKVTLYSGEKKEITYGGFKNGTFCESCHLKCVLGRHCYMYANTLVNCQYCLEHVGFYMF